VEAYGIIGAFTGITSFVWLFDFGIATNINREMSSFSTTEDKRRLLDLKRTLEASIYVVSGVIFVLLLGFVYLVAHYWISTENFSAQFMMSVMAILSFSLAVQFPSSFYSNGLIGLNQQVVLNGVTMLVNTARCVGAVVAIVLFEDKIRAFLIFQSLAALCGLLMLKLVFERAIPTQEYRPRVDLSLLKKIRKFSSELFANNVVVIALTQTDKVILSRMLSLEQFGYYMLAYNIVTMTISTFSNSVNNVLFPILVRHLISGDVQELKRSFHLGTRVTSWGAVSIGTVLVFLSEPILRVWTHN
jgi:O-antigen/teichoic acid export membrane protein